MGIEPTFSAWEADVLPLNDTRESTFQILYLEQIHTFLFLLFL
jgi:hypothetical protein